MKKRKKIIGILSFGIGAGILLLLAVLVPGSSVRKNNWALAESMRNLKGMESGTEVFFSDITPFLWEFVYSFDPYTSKEEMEEVLNTKSSQIRETVNEGMTQLIFLHEGEVVASICGYAENLGYDIDLGLWENGKHYQRIDSDIGKFTLYTDADYPRLVFEGEVFQGTIEELWEIGDTAVVVIDEGYPIRSSGDRVYISLPEKVKSQAKIGDRVEVNYDGWVVETFPLQLTGQMRVCLTPAP